MDAREARLKLLLRAARTGDEGAYERFLAEVATMMRPRIRAKLARFGVDRAESEDVLQEVLVALHLKRGTWDESRPLMPWLNAIAEYKTLDACRRAGRERRRTASVTVDDLEPVLAAEPPADTAAMALDPARAISRLPRRERAIVSALGLEGRSVAAAAAEFSVSEGAVRVAFHRGLKRLAEMADTAAPRRTKR
jgi:RNA polymerase sigma-70 factor (ECF subfamily)